MCCGSEAGSYLRLIDCVYHSTLGLRVIQKKKKNPEGHGVVPADTLTDQWSHVGTTWRVFKAHRLLYHSTLGLRLIKKKKAGLSGHTSLGIGRLAAPLHVDTPSPPVP